MHFFRGGGGEVVRLFIIFINFILSIFLVKFLPSVNKDWNDNSILFYSILFILRLFGDGGGVGGGGGWAYGSFFTGNSYIVY